MAPLEVRRHRCRTCIYRQDAPVDIPKLEAEVLPLGGFRVCHHTIDVCCAGFYAKHRDSLKSWSSFVRVDTDFIPDYEWPEGIAACSDCGHPGGDHAPGCYWAFGKKGWREVMGL